MVEPQGLSSPWRSESSIGPQVDARSSSTLESEEAIPELSADQEVNPELPPDEPPRPKRAADVVERNVPRETSVPEEPLPHPASSVRVVVANQKGGVGKTTTAVNLAVALSRAGLRTVLVDMDPQGNASTALGVNHDVGTPGTYEVLLGGASLAEMLTPSPESENLSVLPATIDLAAAELELVAAMAREQRLNRAVNAYLADHEVDFVFYDCPPSLGLLTVNALVAATEICLPIQCEYYALEGVTQLVRTINLVTGDLNPNLQLATVILTMFDGRTRLSAQVADEVRRHFGEQTLQTIIPRSVRISEAPSYGKSVLGYDPNSVGANAYRAAAKEFAERHQERS